MVLKIQKWNKVLELFFNSPERTFTIREISKQAKVPTTTTQRYLKELRKENIINDENRFLYNPYSKFLKTFFIISKMHETGLMDYLTKELNPSLMILFGGIRKGEYDENSDLDLFIETPIKKELNLKRFEKMLNHKIDLFIEPDINKVNKNLFNNLINGIKLAGYLKIK